MRPESVLLVVGYTARPEPDHVLVGRLRREAADCAAPATASWSGRLRAPRMFTGRIRDGHAEREASRRPLRQRLPRAARHRPAGECPCLARPREREDERCSIPVLLFHIEIYIGAARMRAYQKGW